MQLDDVDLDKRLSKDEAERTMPPLRTKLGELQRAARAKMVPVVLTFDGWDTVEMAEHVNGVIRALDPRGFELHSIEAPSQEESDHEFLWRFIRLLPPAGRIAIFDRSWYSRAAVDEVEAKQGDLSLRTQQIAGFERMLAGHGTVLVKLFFHMSRKELKRRIEKAKAVEEAACFNGRGFFKREKLYDEYYEVTEAMRRETDRPWAPWNVIPAEDDRYALMDAMSVTAATVEAGLRGPSHASFKVELPKARKRLAFDGLDLGASLPNDVYRSRMKAAQDELSASQCVLRKRRKALAVVIEGWDAAGKGGAILRLTSELNPRFYRVVPVGAPNDLEKSHHYLWRFSVNMPARGRMTIFDRSWYGRVLVERVEGLCTEEEWRRSYREINDMEASLAAEGTVIVKLWLQIDKETQLLRFREREGDPDKQWKITEEDWRNRSRWEDYELAIQDMFRYTDTEHAPWTIVESNDKHFSRVKVVETVLAAVKGYK